MLEEGRALQTGDLYARFYPEFQLGGFTDVDGTIRYYLRVNALLQPDFVVADIGCGRGAYGEDSCTFRRNLRILRGKCREVVGVDMDPAARENPFIDRFCLLQDSRWPFEDASIDMVVTDSVIEHVADPRAFFAEVARTLKPGGYFCFRTTNKLGYVALAAMLIPNRFHAKVVGHIQHDREARDVFPTVYRANTIWRIRSLFELHGLGGYVSGLDGEPSYFAFSRTAFRIGMLFHGLTPNWFKPWLVAYAYKPVS